MSNNALFLTETVTHATLVSLGVRWLKRRCSIVFAEFSTAAGETPDVIGWKSGFSVLIECKASRSDFLRDAKKIFRNHSFLGMGQQRYYLCPPEVIGPKDLPPGWGLLWAYRNRVVVKNIADAQEDYSLLSELKFLNSMLRRAQIRIADRPLSEWLRFENMDEAKRLEAQQGAILNEEQVVPGYPD